VVQNNRLKNGTTLLLRGRNYLLQLISRAWGDDDDVKSNSERLSNAEIHVKNYSKMAEMPKKPRDRLAEPKGVATSDDAFLRPLYEKLRRTYCGGSQKE
jgi:hypothetical protein